MGCAKSKEAYREESAKKGFSLLAADTPFTESEVESLYDLFKKLSASVVNDGYIQKEELQLALFNDVKQNSLFLDRIFDLFDLNRDGHIEFMEFVRTLAVFHPSTPQTDKIKYAFKLYDLRHTGYIERVELKEMVLALLKESSLNLADDFVDSIVDKTFKEADANGDGKIDEQEWREYAEKNPSLLKNMTLPYLADVKLAFPSFVLPRKAAN